MSARIPHDALRNQPARGTPGRARANLFSPLPSGEREGAPKARKGEGAQARQGRERKSATAPQTKPNGDLRAALALASKEAHDAS